MCSDPTEDLYILGETFDQFLEHIRWSEEPPPTDAEIAAQGYPNLEDEQLAHEIRMVSS